jgi:hypothetical protein
VASPVTSPSTIFPRASGPGALPTT